MGVTGVAGAGAAAALAPMISIFWMMTGFSGASALNGPLDAGGGLADVLDHVHALHDASEDGVAPAGRHRVEVRVVDQVHEELRVARVRWVAARHAHGAALVLQAVAGLVEDALVRGFDLLGVASKPPPWITKFATTR